MAALAGVALLACMGIRLAEFPGLHGDEAWFGLAAMRVLDNGLESAHGMNRYTGPVHTLVLAGTFRLLGAGAGTLRAPGIAANALAFFLLAAFLRKHASARAGAHLILAVLGSLMFVLYARVSWEVTALHPLLMACVIVCVARVLGSGREGVLDDLLFFGAILLGVTSHFIFGMLPLTLATAAAACALLRPAPRTLRVLVMCGAGLALAAIVFLVKPGVSEEAWHDHPIVLLLAWVLLPAGMTALVRLERVRALSHLPDARRLEDGTIWSLSMRLLMTVGGLAVALWMATAGLGSGFLDVLSGNVVLMRLASLELAALPGAVLGAEAWLLLGAGLVSFLASVWTRRQGLEMVLLFSVTLFCWPVTFVLAGAPFASSIRYYSMPALLLIWIVVLALEHVPLRPLRGLATAVLVAGALAGAGAAWNATAAKPHRPLRFDVGRMEETSAHFLPVGRLVDEARRIGVCRFEGSYFVREPLKFQATAERWPCDRKIRMEVDYCDDCETAPFRVEITRKGS